MSVKQFRVRERGKFSLVKEGLFCVRVAGLLTSSGKSADIFQTLHLRRDQLYFQNYLSGLFIYLFNYSSSGRLS